MSSIEKLFCQIVGEKQMNNVFYAWICAKTIRIRKHVKFLQFYFND